MRLLSYWDLSSPVKFGTRPPGAGTPAAVGQGSPGGRERSHPEWPATYGGVGGGSTPWEYTLDAAGDGVVVRAGGAGIRGTPVPPVDGHVRAVHGERHRLVGDGGPAGGDERGGAGLRGGLRHPRVDRPNAARRRVRLMVWRATIPAGPAPDEGDPPPGRPPPPKGESPPRDAGRRGGAQDRGRRDHVPVQGVGEGAPVVAVLVDGPDAVALTR